MIINLIRLRFQLKRQTKPRVFHLQVTSSNSREKKWTINRSSSTLLVKYTPKLFFRDARVLTRGEGWIASPPNFSWGKATRKLLRSRAKTSECFQGAERGPGRSPPATLVWPLFPSSTSTAFARSLPVRGDLRFFQNRSIVRSCSFKTNPIPRSYINILLIYEVSRNKRIQFQ